SPIPQRLPLSLERTMRTRYRIDDYQHTYFVIDRLQQLLDFASADFAPLYTRLRQMPEIAADERLADEVSIPV
ncbi:MAG: phenylalanine 4-monooxygenase, partial [Comamonas sp.]